MKKALLFFLIPLLSLTACGSNSSDPFKRFYNKKYFASGQNDSPIRESTSYYKFYENHLGYGDSEIRYACCYESQKLLYNYKNDNYQSIELDMTKEYIHVYALGYDPDYPTRYQTFGFFYDDNTFVLVYVRYQNSYIEGVYTSK